MRILAGGSCEMRESPAECVRVGNYVFGIDEIRRRDNDEESVLSWINE